MPALIAQRSAPSIATGNNVRLLLDNVAPRTAAIEYLSDLRHRRAMKQFHTLSLAVTLVLVLSGAANAVCFADYKAKRDKPLRLHYGVIELSDTACADPAVARIEIADRIAADNWNLLTVLSIFGRGGLSQREKNAGRFFLRY